MLKSGHKLTQVFDFNKEEFDKYGLILFGTLQPNKSGTIFTVWKDQTTYYTITVVCPIGNVYAVPIMFFKEFYTKENCKKEIEKYTIECERLIQKIEFMRRFI